MMISSPRTDVETRTGYSYRIQQTFRLINPHPHAIFGSTFFIILLFNNYTFKYLPIEDIDYLNS